MIIIFETMLNITVVFPSLAKSAIIKMNEIFICIINNKWNTFPKMFRNNCYSIAPAHLWTKTPE